MDNDTILLEIRKGIKYEEDCHIWQNITKHNLPVVYIKQIYKYKNIRHFLWELSDKTKTRGEKFTMSCSNRMCINPEHTSIERIIPIPTPDQIMERLMKQTKYEHECKIWTGVVHKGGYGQLSLMGKTISAHKASYLAKTNFEEISPDMVIRHTCRSLLCINPSHLILGTRRENMEDRVGDGTDSRGSKSCKATITEELATEIKHSKRVKGEKDYETIKDRAKRFRVSVGIVSSIDNCGTWGHIPDRNGKIESEEHRKHRLNVQMSRNRKARKRIWSEQEYEKAGEALYKKKIVRGDGCWEFTGNFPNDYGEFSILGTNHRAHVLSCEISMKRKRKNGELTRHSCHNKKCINPKHLSFGTNSENMIDSVLTGSKTSILDPVKVVEIRESSLTTTELALKYGVSGDCIRNVINIKSWKYV